MKTLVLMRHAKSSWNHPDLSDHARPLNKRGRKSAEALGGWLRDNGWLPDMVLSSDSTRTKETFDGLGLDVPVTFTRALYHTDTMGMKAVIRDATGDTVLMLGHNPGIAEFAANLVRNPPDHHQFFFFPTCATMVATFPIDSWANLRWGIGTVQTFVIPREVMAQ